MISPTDIKKKAENRYSAYLHSIVEGESFFPFIVSGNKKPDADTIKFETELIDLMNYSKDKKGYGYTIEFQTVKTKQHGMQGIPTSISFQTESDYLKYIAKEKEAGTFKEDYGKILAIFPELKEWISRYPTKLIDKNWDCLLKVCTYFKSTPQPNLYIRELPIQVHTKFIESNKEIIKELLDILIADFVDHDQKRFESRFHLRYDEPIVRFRILDQSISHQLFSDIEDISIPISQFKQLVLPAQRVYVVENKINMLSFPMIETGIVIWGHGFGVETICDVDWLKDKDIFYWGDLDAQGFQILSLLRSHYGQVKSFLMDRSTFDKYFEGDKGTPSNVDKDLCLTPEENQMFQYLKVNNLRLEQEKIPYEYALKRILY